MKVRVVVEFDINFETDGEELDYDQLRELDYDQLRYSATECLCTHVENMMNNERELDALVDDVSDCTDFLVNELTYEVKSVYL